MRIRILTISFAAWAVLGLGLPAQTSPATTWDLPHELTVKDAGPRTYRFTVDYNTANATGEIVQRQRVTGDYTRGLANGEVMWKNVGVATVLGATAPFPAAQNQDYMEGFRYRNAIAPNGMIWVSWPKKSSGVASDLTDVVVRDTALPLGLVDTKVCAIDDTWSGLKFVIPKNQR